MGKYVTTTDELNGLQYDALWESIEDNPYLPYKTSDFSNKSLNTSNKRIIKAINEILKIAETAKENADSVSNRFNVVIGNETGDPTLLEELQKIDENFFKALFKINKQVNDLNNGIGDIEAVNNEVQTAIDTLNKKVAELEKLNYVSNYEEFPTLNVEDQSITLSHPPRLKSSISLFINGIYYPTTTFTLENNKLVWNTNNDSFGLDNDFEIVVRYDYLSE